MNLELISQLTLSLRIREAFIKILSMDNVLKTVNQFSVQQNLFDKKIVSLS